MVMAKRRSKLGAIEMLTLPRRHRPYRMQRVKPDLRVAYGAVPNQNKRPNAGGFVPAIWVDGRRHGHSFLDRGHDRENAPIGFCKEGLMLQKCNLTTHARKVRDVRKLRPQVSADLRPLFNHILKLSIDSAKRGYCQRAGQELRHARKLSTLR
jgi:hypothetical protein